MARLAVLDPDNWVVNVVELEPTAAWSAPPNTTLRDAGGAGIGWHWNGVDYDAPALVIVPPSSGELRRLRFNVAYGAAATPAAQFRVLADFVGELLT